MDSLHGFESASAYLYIDIGWLYNYLYSLFMLSPSLDDKHKNIKIINNI